MPNDHIDRRFRPDPNPILNERQDASGAPAPSTDSEATAGTALKVSRPRPRLDRLPPWKVLLHNDDESDMLFVVDTIVVLGVATRQDAISRMFEAHETGCALLTTTHRERAELLQEQFESKGLTVTIEPE